MLANENLLDERRRACRFCKSELRHTFVDLGMSPLCESYLRPEQLSEAEPFYPLRVFVCARCFLVQLEEFVSPASIFTEYAYFSSYSDSWLEHCQRYTEQMTDRFHLDTKSLVVEVASNDGYLLQYFAKKGIPVLGIEPAANVARAAEDRKVPTLVRFFGNQLAAGLASEGKRADLLVGNNVLAQVPDICDFVAGIKTLLKPGGVLTLEFPHLLKLIEENQFDTIYHEHFSYFSFCTAKEILGAYGLELFDVEELPTHGGSLRIFGKHVGDETKPVSSRVRELCAREEAVGLMRLEVYGAFAEKVKRTKRQLLQCLIGAKQARKSIVGYGAPGKGNTLLNYCGVRTDFIDYTVDRNPFKHGRFTPGTHIPIHPPERIFETRPDYVLILPWNLKTEIMRQMNGIVEWGGKFIVPIPEASICP
jgi:2-polyprenyl-3-methyl-5-hydroxy-6-metoxy-1,4-benzoquinol methylase